MRRFSQIALVLTIGTILDLHPTHAQDVALSGAAILSEARSLITQLQNLSASVGGDVMIATNNAATQVSTATDHLQQALKDQVNVPITQLTDTVRDEALLLNSMVTQINTLIDRQRACLFAQADVFVGGINTVIATLKSGVPLVSAGGPTVTSFQFDGHLTPNIVPSDGGRFVVKGFHLWADEVPPRVTLTDKDNAVLANLQPSRAADDNSYRAVLAPELMAKYAGACVYVTTVPRERKRLLRIPTGASRDIATLVLPMCVPQTTTMKVRLTAQITYDVPKPDSRPLAYQNFRFDNSECGHRHSVSMTKGWSLPEGYTITSVENKLVEQKNDDNHIQFSFGANTITAAGDQASPTCGEVHVGFVNIEKLFHPAIWSYDARPVIAGTAYLPQGPVSSQSSLVDLTMPATQLCASMAKLANTPGRKTSISYTITPVINGKEASAFSSPVYTTDDAMNSYALPSTAAFGGEFTISGAYNPTPVDGKCQACVTLTALNQCGF